MRDGKAERSLLIPALAACLVLLTLFGLALLFVSGALGDQKGAERSDNGGASLAETDIEEMQSFASYDMEAIATISGTEEGASGGALSHLWIVTGRVVRSVDGGTVLVRVNGDCDYSKYLMQDIYIDCLSLPDQGKGYSAGDTVEIRFLPNLSQGVIKPVEMFRIGEY